MLVLEWGCDAAREGSSPLFSLSDLLIYGQDLFEVLLHLPAKKRGGARATGTSVEFPVRGSIRAVCYIVGAAGLALLFMAGADRTAGFLGRDPLSIVVAALVAATALLPPYWGTIVIDRSEGICCRRLFGLGMECVAWEEIDHVVGFVDPGANHYDGRLDTKTVVQSKSGSVRIVHHDLFHVDKERFLSELKAHGGFRVADPI